MRKELNLNEVEAIGVIPGAEYVFGDREGMCISYTCADSGEDAIAEIEAAYRDIVESNKRRDAQPKPERTRSPSVKVEFNQQEVCRRAMVVHEREVAFEQAKRILIGIAMIFKCQHGIARLDFQDDAYKEFSSYALADRRAAARELNLARARLATATKGYAALIAKFGFDPYQKHAERALAMLAYDDRLLGDGPIVLTCTEDDMRRKLELRELIVAGEISMKDALADRYDDGRPMVSMDEFIQITRNESYIAF